MTPIKSRRPTPQALLSLHALLFADEGHSIIKWPNRLAVWRKIEDTLATCLGGRNAGFDFYQLMPR